MVFLRGNHLVLSEIMPLFAEKLSKKINMAFEYDLHENPNPNGNNKRSLFHTSKHLAQYFLFKYPPHLRRHRSRSRNRHRKLVR